jgi:hypothetical protein
MQLLPAGALICIMLILVARWSGGLLAVLIGSLAFGATAALSLSSLGGSSPLIFTMLQIILICSVVLKRSFIRDLWSVMSQQPTAWIVLIFMIYAIGGSIILPRLFFGQTTAFVPMKMELRIAEVPLSPVSGNVTQTLYFVLNVLTFFAVSVLFSRENHTKAIRNGFFFWATLLVVTGFMDLIGKLTGAGDLLEPIRTASYSMLTDVEQAGFFRIAGPYAEASAFGAATVVTLAFMFTYWRATRDRIALIISILLLLLLLLSTSSTAYVGAALISLPLFFSILKTATTGRISRPDLFLLSCGIGVIVMVVAIELYDDKILDPIWDLFNTMILNKASSASGQERAYWNLKSIASFFDTAGLGIGLGSSRASSWIVAVISQFGLIGSLLLAAMTYQIISKRWIRMAENGDGRTQVIARSLRSAVLASLVTATVAGGGADPGILFFVGLAVSSSFRRRTQYNRPYPAGAVKFPAMRRLATESP